MALLFATLSRSCHVLSCFNAFFFNFCGCWQAWLLIRQSAKIFRLFVVCGAMRPYQQNFSLFKNKCAIHRKIHDPILYRNTFFFLRFASSGLWPRKNKIEPLYIQYIYIIYRYRLLGEWACSAKRLGTHNSVCWNGLRSYVTFVFQPAHHFGHLRLTPIPCFIQVSGQEVGRDNEASLLTTPFHCCLNEETRYY